MMQISTRRRVQVVLASEAAECGLACMAMVARYHGHDIDLNGLRQRFSTSISGVSVRNLMTLADQLELSARPVSVDLAALGQLRLPAIIHWDFNHFVVLTRVGRDRITIIDPARGERSYSHETFSPHFTGVALEVTPSASFKPIVARHRLRIADLWSSAIGLRREILFVLMLSVLLQATAFLTPLQIQLVVDEAIGHGDSSILLVIATGFGALIVLQVLIESIRAWSLNVLGNLFTYQVYGNIFRHLIRLPSSFFGKRHVGDIVSRMDSTFAIKDAITQGLVAALVDGAMAMIAIVFLVLYSAKLTLVVLASLLLSLLSACLFYPAMRARTEEMLGATAQERSYLMESVRAATTVKLLGRELERENRWRAKFATVAQASIAVGGLKIYGNAVQSILMGLTTVLVIFLGAKIVIESNGLSVGMLIAFLSFRQTFSDRVVSLINQGIQFQLVRMHLDRLSDIVSTEKDVFPQAPTEGLVQGAMQVKNLSFRYASTERWILKDFNLSIAAGEFVAIVGPSGGGKTTLLKILLGLEKPTSGAILLDGEPASTDLWGRWRDQIGVVSQDDQLISGTIADNIAFMDPDLDMDRVREAAMAARIDGDIGRMPMRYLTLVGEMGTSLSGGQRQRVLLARALYRRPRVLILDEGTANLDLKTELEITKLVSSLSITRIVVAHRAALVDAASRVIELQPVELNSIGFAIES